MNPVFAAIGVAQSIGELSQHAQAEVFQNRQYVRQRQRGVGVVQLAVQGALANPRERLVETHGQWLAFRQGQHML